jgi:5-methylcytosine-specific restriction endonuclease McrBC regulatory subunit McrC
MILDAKYKHLGGKVGRDDLYQVVTYMYCMKYQLGGYIYPSDKDNIDICEYKLAGYEGSIKVLPLYIPQDATNWFEFASAIKNNEEELQGKLFQ